MGNSLATRLKHAWNVFRKRDPTPQYPAYGYGSSYRRPDRTQIRYTNEKNIVTSIYNQIALDVSMIPIQHVRTDQNGSYAETIKSGLNNAITLEANVDQTAKAFIQDVVISMFDDGCVAIVPIETIIDPTISGAFDIQTLRTGKILEWYPQDIRVRVYNELTGQREDILVPKKICGIIENPRYMVMNEPNSTLQRLIRKLNILDAIDEQSGSGKLDLIIQLPYVIKSAARQEQADQRKRDMEVQLAGSKYGIAYTDATEKITQLNRPAENNLMNQIEYLIKMVYGQLGITEEVLNGTADEATMLNYHRRTVIPIITAITDELKRKFLTKTARSQNQDVMSFRDIFEFVTITNMADLADKLTRNEILSSNEMRAILKYKPSTDPKADELRNKNLNQRLPSGNEVSNSEGDDNEY